MKLIQKLAPLRGHGGDRLTVGLDDQTVERFAATHPELVTAMESALDVYESIKIEFADVLDLNESEQVAIAQSGFVNFYPDDAVNPYIALAARGPWIITLKGAVLHDSGGYGMLGFGHTPDKVLEAMAKPQAMANIMTPSLSHLRLVRALRREIGHTRGNCPYHKFLALNSGSESVSLAGRIADVNTRIHTDAGGRHAGKKVKRLAVKGAFHGRTELPALYSDSSRKAYMTHLASYPHHADQLITIEPYSIEAVRKAFADADANGWYFEAMFIEPVMGEGDPGRALPVEFYAEARRLTKEHGTLLLIDSIQAGLRAPGVLSIVDYPGFEGQEAPDMETYSKALNAGQFPLSILATTEHAAGLYRKGIYGNTMTANPRAMDVASTVLSQLTAGLRNNIRDRGQEFLDKLNTLKSEMPGSITKVQGTGLLFSCELGADFKCFGTGSTEEYMRQHGLGVIHGGVNSLRFTPNFNITSAEVDLIINQLRNALADGPRLSKDQAA